MVLYIVYLVQMNSLHQVGFVLRKFFLYPSTLECWVMSATVALSDYQRQHPSLQLYEIYYDSKKFYSVGPSGQFRKTFFRHNLLS